MLVWLKKWNIIRKVESYGLKKQNYLKEYIKMEEVIKFGDIEIQNKNFTSRKKLFQEKM